ncbi:hypothetical protein X975_22112, partial [Stegodyphus mimosarum]
HRQHSISEQQNGGKHVASFKGESTLLGFASCKHSVNSYQELIFIYCSICHFNEVILFHNCN